MTGSAATLGSSTTLTSSMAVTCSVTGSISVTVVSTTTSLVASGSLCACFACSKACSAASFAKRRRSRGSLATRLSEIAVGGVKSNTGAGSASGAALVTATSRVTGCAASASVA